MLNIISRQVTCIDPNLVPMLLEQIKTCTRCHRTLLVDNFKQNKDGMITKVCTFCLDKMKKQRDKINMCMHDINRHICIPCRGKHVCQHLVLRKECSICEGKHKCLHNKLKYSCYECEGSSICKHKKHRNRCHECYKLGIGGGSFCIHNKTRVLCVTCGGTQLCSHNRQPYGCIYCASESCTHNIPKRMCNICRTKGWCKHGNHKHTCVECMGRSICIHKKNKSNCRECYGSSFCIHDKYKRRCKQCLGAFICPHLKEKDKCTICDFGGHLKSIVSCRVRSSLKQNKLDRTINYLGCDIGFYKSYLESKFTEGMSWSNYGKWQIDHKIPVKYNNPTIEEIISRLHYTNTQPLWKEDNMKKGNRYIS